MTARGNGGRRADENPQRGCGTARSQVYVAPWVRGYRKNVYYTFPPWQYLDIDPVRKG